MWDLRYPDPEQLLYTYYGIHVNYFEYTLADHAIPHNTPWHEPQGPMVVPGQYRDPAHGGRADLPAADYGEARPAPERIRRRSCNGNWIWRRRSPASMNATYEGYNQAAQLRSRVGDRLTPLKQPGKSPDALAAAQALDTKAQGLTDAAGPPPGLGP